MILALISPALAAPPAYEETLAEADALLDDGRPLSAARRLEALRAAYPQDYAAASAAGWAWYEGMAWGRAEAAFSDADALSSGAAAPGLAAVSEAREPRVRARPSVAASLFTGHPEWTHGYAGGAGLDATLEGRVLAGALIQGGSLVGPGGRSPWLAGHAGAGATWLRWGVMAHGAALGGMEAVSSPADDAASPGQQGARSANGGNGGNSNAGEGEAHGNAQRGPPARLESALAGGASARWSPWGDLYLESGATRWAEGVAWRGTAAWSSPAAGPLRLRPGGSLQRGVDGPGWSTFGALRLEGEGGALEVGGRYGDEERPVALGLRSIHPLPGRVGAGAWAGGLLSVGALELELGWEWLRSSVDDERVDLNVAALAATWNAGGVR